MENGQSTWKRIVTLDYLNTLTAHDIGLFVLRLGTLAIFFHGWSKVQNYEGFVGFLGTAPVGSWAPGFFGFLVVAGQLLLGIALTLGLFTRWSALWLACMFAFIIFAVNIPSNGLLVDGSIPFEPSLFYFIPGLVLLLTGPGRLSLDHVLFGRK